MGPDLLRADLAVFLPQFALRLAHRGLVLVPPTDVELLELAEIVAEPGGVLPPDQEHLVTWPVGTDDAARAFLREHWDLRTAPHPGRWVVAFAVVLDGRALGVAVLGSTAEDGVLATRCWLARAEQGRELGRRVRLMLLELAFAHLGARRVVASAASAHAASRRVSARLGYRETGTGRGAKGTDEVHVAITPAPWRRRRLADVEVDGVARFRSAIG